MSRRAMSFVLVACAAGACLHVDDGEPAFEPPDAGKGSVVTTSGPATGGNGGATASPTTSAATGGAATGGAGGAAGSGGTHGGAGSDAGAIAGGGKGGTGGSVGAAGAPPRDGGARVCKGGMTGMCPPPYSAAGAVGDICKAYCDCMSAQCPDTAPANCLATCQTQIDKWDICCRINKCLTRPCDYKDQFIGDCKAAVGIQACLDKT